MPISLVIISIGFSFFAWANNDQQINEKVSGSNDEAKETLEVAPDFSLKDLSGRSVSLSQYRGKTVLLGFWTTW
jgi:cytochrome oxidase Cu insertion factor (SCO1/SenC/PrrC family)